MVQIQNGRLIVNWLKGEDNTYPRFSQTGEELRRVFELLKVFLEQNTLDQPRINQWEVTYVNHIPQGVLWKQAEDLKELFPSLLVTSKNTSEYKLESIEANWRMLLPDNRGRLHVELNHGWKDQNPSSEQVIVLQFTARGPVDIEKNQTLESGLNIGHDSIVRTFTESTSAKAHQHWEHCDE